MTGRCIQLVVSVAAGLLTAAELVRADPIALTANKAYTQDFDTLEKGANNATFKWENDKTLSGWFVSIAGNKDNGPPANYISSDGSGTVLQGGLYSFGTLRSTDRALGTYSTQATGTITIEADFINKTGLIITSIKVSYIGEQWRDGGTTADMLSVSSNVNPLKPGPVPQLDFPNIKQKGSGALDGNAAANRLTTLAFTFTQLDIPPDAPFYIRWSDAVNGRPDHGLAIDDLVVTVVGTMPAPKSVPEPSSLALMGLAGAGLLGWMRWRTRPSQGCAVSSASSRRENFGFPQ